MGTQTQTQTWTTGVTTIALLVLRTGELKTLTFLMKILHCKSVTLTQGHARAGDGADKNLRPISTIMPNMNEIHQRVFKI